MYALGGRARLESVVPGLGSALASIHVHVGDVWLNESEEDTSILPQGYQHVK